VARAERRALLVTTRAAARTQVSGAGLRVQDVEQLLDEAGYSVRRCLVGAVPEDEVDLGVAVSYASVGALRSLRRQARRTWLDVTDSWLAVDGSALRRGHLAYGLRAVRDGLRLATAPRADLVTWISAADRRADRGTVRGATRLVLPGRTAPPGPPGASTGRRVVLAGDWDYPPNRDGLQWFLRAVLPRLLAGAPEAAWEVVVHGPGAPPVDRPRLRVAGFVPQDRLHLAGDVHAAPVRFGGGVKRKVLQPLQLGLPVVTTSAGASGLRPHALLDVRDDAVGFADALLERLAAPAPPPTPTPTAQLVDADDTTAVLDWLAR
jgi:hypothetical protein